MKITIYHAKDSDDLLLAHKLLTLYQKEGWADGSRPTPRKCVIFGKERTVAVWGGPEHIRAAFPRPLNPHDDGC
ncbi:hypothetical protein [Roseococcus pinisoli]|uniref:DUF1737 domain-containing protein n=1 Tax=Roseococcus pinisoli TaxID=2835040 RepID=A0ABS5QF15_9PROT|nr:hypothetical protein [Roseococcus pinisoli]MBS7812281.1 hypothetical protein [Roseococcus pinisoli]